MEIEYAFLARYVEPASDATLTITGADLGTVRIRTFPGFTPAFSVVVKLKADAPLPKFRVHVRGPASVGTVFSTGETWHTTRGVRPKDSNAAIGPRFVLTIPQLQFPEPGSYETVVELDTGTSLRLPFSVLQTEERNDKS